MSGFRYTADIFKEGFQPKDFVDTLSRRLIYEQTVAVEKDELSESFDPKPFIDLFNTTLNSLKEMSTQVDAEIIQLEKELNQSEVEHKRTLVELNKTFEVVYNEFQQLDRRIYNVGSTAVRIGDSLSGVDKDKRRAEEALDLINHFIELNGDSVEGTGIFDDGAKLFQTVSVIKKLNSVTAEMNMERTQRGKKAVERVSEKVEKDLLDRFRRASQKNDYQTMKKCAHALFDFNGGDSCVRTYIMQLSIFFDTTTISKDQLLCSSIEKRLSEIEEDDISHSSMEIPELNAFFQDLEKTCQLEHEIISQVFPNSSIVLSQLVQRIFEQKISSLLEKLFQDLSTSLILSLRTIALSYNLIQNLVKQLETYDLANLNLELLVNSIFLSYKEQYLEKEMKALNQIFESKIRSFRRAIKLEQETLNSSALIGQTPTQLKLPITGNTQPQYDPFDLEISLEVALSSLHASEEALKRALKFSTKDETPQYVFQLFSLLLKYLGYEYLVVYLERELNRIPKLGESIGSAVFAPKEAPKLEFFNKAQSLNHVVILLQRHFHQEVLPHILPSINDHTHCVMEMNTLMSVLESKIAEGLERSCDVMLDYIQRLFRSEQKRNDFRPTEDQFDTNTTFVCGKVVNYLLKQIGIIEECLDGRNRTKFLRLFGLRLYNVILEHLKDVSISLGLGGMKLMRDVTEYKEVISRFQVAEVDEKFEILRQVPNLFIVEDANIKTVLEESNVSKLDRTDVLHFVKKREDSKSSWFV